MATIHVKAELSSPSGETTLRRFALASGTFSALMARITSSFPGAGIVSVTWRDEDDDWITILNDDDLAIAIDAAAAATRTMRLRVTPTSEAGTSTPVPAQPPTAAAIGEVAQPTSVREAAPAPSPPSSKEAEPKRTTSTASGAAPATDSPPTTDPCGGSSKDGCPMSSGRCRFNRGCGRPQQCDPNAFAEAFAGSFGLPLHVLIESLGSSARFSQTAPTPTPEHESQWDTELERLRAMGFDNVDALLPLLEQFKGSVERIVALLVEA